MKSSRSESPVIIHLSTAKHERLIEQNDNELKRFLSSSNLASENVERTLISYFNLQILDGEYCVKFRLS